MRLGGSKSKRGVSFVTPWLLLRRRQLSSNQGGPYTRTSADGSFPKAQWLFQKCRVLANKLLAVGGAQESRALSPVSFQLVLSLLAAGSGGRTRRQLLTLFGVDDADTLNFFSSQLRKSVLAGAIPVMRCDNAIWTDESVSLTPSFQRLLHSHYLATSYPSHFYTQSTDVRQRINSWVGSVTGGHVNDLISEGSLHNSVKLVITNALYFKGSWDEEARPPFKCVDDVSKDTYEEASLMIAKRQCFARYCNAFNNVIHPYQKLQQDKRSFIHHFTYPEPRDYIYDADWVRDSVAETLVDVRGRLTPAFDISSELEASHVLRQLGVTLPFYGGNFSEMVTSFDHQDSYVSNILQKSFMKVNEQGTEVATATTAILMSGRRHLLDLPPVPKIEGHNNFPFLPYAGSDHYGEFYMARTHLYVDHLFDPLPS